MEFEEVIILAMAEMEKAGLPIKSFEPCKKHGGFDFFFSKGLTPKQENIAKKIAKKYIPTTWSFHRKKTQKGS